MQNTTEYDITITDIAYGGRGVGRVDNLVIFVPGAALGERVKARIVRQRKSFAEAEIIEIMQAARDRIQPDCPLAKICPGCCYQHLNYPTEIRAKEKQLSGLLKRLVGIEQPPTLPTIPAPQHLGYRNKIVLHAGKKVLGYYAHDNQTILDTPQCLLAMSPINERLTELRQAGMPEFGAEITMRHTIPDGVRHWQGAPDRKAPWLREQTILGELRVPCGSFFQVNPAVANLMLKEAIRIITETNPRRLIDFYCGIGVFAWAAANAGIPDVTGVDNDPHAIRAARHNARKLSHNKINFLIGTADSALALCAVPGDNQATMIILDPPRAGLGPGMIAGIAKSRPGLVLYCSCAPDTMARDIKLLTDAGYRLEQIRLFDMFPRTMHFESMAVLRRICG